MQYSKTGAALAAALAKTREGKSAALDVFVHTAAIPTGGQRSSLEDLGVAIAPGATIFTARLSPQAIEELSQQPWVEALRLSQRLRLLRR